MNVVFFWEGDHDFTLNHPGNPYGPLLAMAMARQNVTFLPGNYDFEKSWLEETRAEAGVLHINWAHHFYKAEDLASSLKKLKRFTDNLHFAKSLGFRIVWTFHNLYPHERPYPEIDHEAQLVMCQVADEIVAHCQYAADRCAELFHRPDHLSVVPHGNYIDAYANTMSKTDARHRLGISPDARVFTFTGNARPYKGIDRLVETFQRIAAPEEHLVLMMRHFRFNPAYALDFVEMAQEIPNITAVSSDHFDRTEFQDFLGAADIAVLPFVDVLTSGSAILALSFGLPAILPRLGCLPEVISDREGILFDPSSPTGLEEAMIASRDLDLATMSKNALARAHQFDWDTITSRLITLYRTEGTS